MCGRSTGVVRKNSGDTGICSVGVMVSIPGLHPVGDGSIPSRSTVVTLFDN